jgi:hypothetical protein
MLSLTFLGGVFHTLRFLINSYHVALVVEVVVVSVELLLLAWLRHVFFETPFGRSLVFVSGGGAIAIADPRTPVRAAVRVRR